MNTKLFKYIIAFVLTFLALPMMAQDFLTLHFKNGTSRVFHFSNLKALSTSKDNTTGTQYQHITTNDHEFVYDLATIDSVSFTKYNKDLARNYFSSAINVSLSYLAECESISDVEKNLEIIRSAEGVEKAWMDGHFLHIKPINCKPFIVDVESPNYKSHIESRALSRLSESVKIIERPDMTKLNDGRLKMVIANEMNDDMFYWWQDNITNHLNPLKNKLEDAGISVKYVPMPDLEFYRSEMYDYDVVLLCTHGGYFEKKQQHALLSSPILGEVLVTKENEDEIDKSIFQDEYDEIFNDERYKDAIDDMKLFVHKETRIINGVEQRYWVAYPIIYESFIKDRAIKSFTNPKSILFMASCETLKGNDNLAQIFFDNRGLNTYLGYNESTSFCQEAGSHFYESYFNGASAWKAYNDLEDVKVSIESSDESISGSCKKEIVTNKTFLNLFNTSYTVELKMLSKDKKDEDFIHFFLSSPDTNDIDEGRALESYNKGKTVSVSATIMALDPQKVVKGFIYGTDKYHFTEDKKAEIAMKTLETGKGNYLIQAKLDNLKPGNTYHYCAYTYDGLNYNYGDTCSFTLYHNLQVSVQKLELEIGKKVSFTINSGNGDYAVEVDKEDVATATLEGGTVIVKAISFGDATITVTDNKTGQAEMVNVTVTKDDKQFVLSDSGLICLSLGESYVINILKGGEDNVTVNSTNWDAVAVGLDVGTIILYGMKVGSAVLTIDDSKSGERVIIEVNVTEEATPIDIPAEAVDLGLPSGTLWAKWNMGATAPEEYGDYYAWGETEMKKGYGWYNYEHCDGTKETCHDIGAEISGTKYDVAHVKWGGDWQLPTADQIDELVDNCQHKVTTSKGVKGTLVTGPNGNTIFLPCAGFMAGTTLYGPGKYGLYKSGTRCGSDMRESWLLNADADGFVRLGIWNSTGHSVRPVISGK